MLMQAPMPMLTKPPSQAEFEECWSEAIIKNDLDNRLVLLLLMIALSQGPRHNRSYGTISRGHVSHEIVDYCVNRN